MRKAGVVTYLFGDHLGSTSVAYNDAENTESRQGYTAFGSERYSLGGDMPTRYQFTGQRGFEEIGLQYYGARWYDGALGRFSQADTIIPEPGSPMAWDRYSYARNSPVMYTDPTGHMPSDGCNYESCDINTFEEYWQVSQYTIEQRFNAAHRGQGNFTDIVLNNVYASDNPITRGAYFEWALGRVGGQNTNQALVDLLYIAGNNLSSGMMGLAMGGDVTAIDLYAFGNVTGPRAPRLGKDILADEFGNVGPEAPPFPDGASTFADPGTVPLTGHYYKLPAGSQLPEGVSVIPDGVDINPLSSNPAGHNTIYPSNSMSFTDFVQKYLSLPWIYGGKK